ncbi:DUF5358 domain-containing protein [Glaesserella parasuis]|uniref:DUF5358 domain-containing protein n=1 Tax=Glaesserella parasuis TaxID=738 RepID=UPI0013663B73|nr:DUF5358 domain-containing protein [Glaesserella parasuis]MWQ32732.1 hypothetical protein [Glaesserella parasuis]
MQYKKTLLAILFVALTSCSAPPVQKSFPGEFANADYVLSDEDSQRWIIASRQAEQCIYPNLTRIQQQHFSKEDAYIHAQYVLFYPLENIIGAEYVKMIQEDEKSMGYAQYQFKKFKESVGKIKPLAEEDCQKLRLNAKDDLAVVKGQYKSGMVENKAENSSEKNPDGVATNENKFFFDIIKWGAALLL